MPPRDTPLICYDYHGESSIRQSTHGRYHAWQQFNLLPRGDVLALGLLSVYHAVPVEENSLNWKPVLGGLHAIDQPPGSFHLG
jgi:hypothetical protein